MAPQTPVGEPIVLTAGDTWRWKVVAPDFPHTDGWALTYHLIGPSGGTISTSADASPATFLAEKSAAASANVAAGTYTWILRAVKGTDVLQVSSGAITIKEDPASAVAELLHEEKMLQAIEAVLEGRIPDDVEEYAIHGRQLTKIPVRELKRLHAQYRYEVWRLQNPGQSNPTRKVAFPCA